MIGVLGHVADYDEARSIVRTLLDGLPSGSYLVETDGTDSSPEYLAAIEMYRDSGGVPYNARTHEEIAGYYEGSGPGRARRRAHPPVAARAQRVRARPPTSPSRAASAGSPDPVAHPPLLDEVWREQSRRVAGRGPG